MTITSPESHAAPTGTRRDLVVEAAGLTKVFHDFWHRERALAVDAVDFHVARHELFGLLGPNGSGKSTTIKMILGLLRRSRGVLRVFGREPSDVSIKRRIGYLPEESYLYRFLNPTETLDYYGKLFGLNRRVRRRRSAELLDMVGLQGAANRSVGEFSKGMARRLGLAQALINDPEFLILDEPTSGLDPVGTRQVKDLLLDLRRRGKTILLSSHLLADVEDVCTRMVILYGGKVRAEGTVDQLLDDSDHTLIRTRRLTPATVSRVEKVLQETEGVSIESVQAPRQKLEDLFMQIVERARREQVATSGAQHGGRTAEFLLKGDEASEPEEGSGVIESLARAETAAPVRAMEVERDSSRRREEAARADVLESLRGAAPSAPAAPGAPGTPAAPGGTRPVPPPSAPAGPGASTPPASPAVDRSFIEGLLGDGGADPASGGKDGGKDAGRRDERRGRDGKGGA